MREFAGQMPGTKIGTHSLCEPAGSKCTWTSHKSHFMRIYRNKSTPQDRAQFVQFCASQNALGQAARAILFFALMCQKKMARPKIGAHSLRRPAQVEMHLDKPRTVCASLRSRNALGQVTKAILRENLQEKSRVPKWRGRLSGDCAAETHMDIAEQEKCRGPDGAPWSSTGLDS